MADDDKDEKKRRSIQGLTLEQLRRRRWMRARGPWVAGIATLVVLGIVAVWLLLFSSVFAVKHVTVTGTAACTDAELASIQKTVDGSIGSHLINADLGKIRSQMDALTCVASVVVSRSWPQTIRVAVTTRTPVAVVQTASGLRSIDATGVIFGRRLGRTQGLPLITLSGQVDRSALRGAAEAAGSLPPTILKQVTSITVRTMDDIRLNLTGGRVVFWGSASDSAIKAEVAVQFLRLHKNVINVSVPSLPTTG